MLIFWKCEAPFVYGGCRGDLRRLWHFGMCVKQLLVLKGAFEELGGSRRLFEVKKLLKISSKFDKINEKRLCVDMCGAFWWGASWHGLLSIFEIIIIQTSLCYILGALEATFRPPAPFSASFHLKKTSKMLTLAKNDWFLLYGETKGAFRL